MPKTSSPSPGPELAAIGYIARAHGVRGELVFVPETDDPSLADGVVYLRPRAGGAARPYAVAGRRRHHGNVLLLLEGLEDRTAAERLKAHTLLIDKARLPALEEDEVYLADLPGLEVETPDGAGGWRSLGRIVAAEAPAGQVLWTIRSPEGKDILFPAVEQFIVSLDPQSGLARIDPPPGLLDLYL